MRIEVHCLLHNEILMLPYFIRHYSQFADIIFYESNSTDGSVEFAELMNCKVVRDENKYNKIDETLFLKIKNNCWKGSTADWVIVCDADEFVYHPDILRVLARSKFTLYRPPEYMMYSKKFPVYDGQIYDKIKYGKKGLKGYNKPLLFKPSQIKEMDYYPGCHVARPQGNVILCENTAIKTLHFHFAGLDYRIMKNRYIATRISQINIQQGWGSHCTIPEKQLRKEFREAMKNLIKVI